MKQSLDTIITSSRLGTGLRWVFQAVASAAVVLALSSDPFAGNNPTGPQSGKGAPIIPNGDGVGTLPFVSSLPSGLILTGTAQNLLTVVRSTTELPQAVFELENQRWAVVFSTGSVVDLDRVALAKGGVRAYLSAGIGLHDALAVISTPQGSSLTVQLDAEAPLDLPLGSLYAPDSDAPALILDAVLPEGDGARYRAVFAPQPSTLRIGQALIE